VKGATRPAEFRQNHTQHASIGKGADKIALKIEVKELENCEYQQCFKINDLFHLFLIRI